MCGITGLADFRKKSDEAVLRRMTGAVSHRGPDDEGLLFVETASAQVGLGHRRLSILDLSAGGHQPMQFQQLSIVFNGEVYNFRLIRSELEGLGYTFGSHSDTEVILKAWHKWGPACLEKFRGMWAFALYNHDTEQLILCRDRVGVKPLYYYHYESLFLFGSELKALAQHPSFTREIDQQALSLFLQYGYISAPFSVFRNTRKVLPGHYVVLDRNGSRKEHCYWSPANWVVRGMQEREIWLAKNESEVVAELEDLLAGAFSLRLVSDVPVGIFLSGGIDSSLVASLLQKNTSARLKTFTIGFHESAYDEAADARKIAEHLGTDHAELYCTAKDARDVIPLLPALYDEPFGDSSAIPAFLVSGLARKAVTVALSADGGDEQFFGYNTYENALGRKMAMDRLPAALRRGAGAAAELLGAAGGTRFRKLAAALGGSNTVLFDQFSKYLLEDEARRLGAASTLAHPSLVEVPQDAEFHQLMALYDLRTYLPDDILVKVDRATMGASLEGREPFLDHRILEYSLRMPLEWKFRNGTRKYILKKILAKHLPPALFDRPKRGFSIPVAEWMRHDLKDMVHHYLSSKKVKEAGLLNASATTGILRRFMKGSRHPGDAQKLWYLLVFQLWKEKWMD
jgi:asparagine synthase (glutamine-hydrolysing)